MTTRAKVQYEAVLRELVSRDSEEVAALHIAAILQKRSAARLILPALLSIRDISFTSFVEWIMNERLSKLPEQGSTWDVVLKQALFVGESLHHLEALLRQISTSIYIRSELEIGAGYLMLLLQFGQENGQALRASFSILKGFVTSISATMSRFELVTMSADSRKLLILMHTTVLALIAECTYCLYEAVNGARTSLDMCEILIGPAIALQTQTQSIIREMWNEQVRAMDIDNEKVCGVQQLSTWLLTWSEASHASDYSIFESRIAEGSTDSAVRKVAQFGLGDMGCLLGNGAPGSGKSILAAAIAERLCRLLRRKLYDVIFYSTDAALTQTTSLDLVQSLLFQLWSIRAGDMTLYQAISKAYEKSSSVANASQLEDILWTALIEYLQKKPPPVSSSLVNSESMLFHSKESPDLSKIHREGGGRDIVIIVDGLDELLKGKQALLGQFLQAVLRAGRAKLIAVVGSSQLPEDLIGTAGLLSVEKREHDEDLDGSRGVVLNEIFHSRVFKLQSISERDGTVSQICRAADGNVLAALLACRLLRLHSSQDGFSQAFSVIQNSKALVGDFTTEILSMLQPSNETRLLLRCLAHRALTYNQIQKALSRGLTCGKSPKVSVDVDTLINSVWPVVVVHKGVVRLVHRLVEEVIRRATETEGGDEDIVRWLRDIGLG